jgi:hypothetical protein
VSVGRGLAVRVEDVLPEQVREARPLQPQRRPGLVGAERGRRARQVPVVLG